MATQWAPRLANAPYNTVSDLEHRIFMHTCILRQHIFPHFPPNRTFCVSITRINTQTQLPTQQYVAAVMIFHPVEGSAFTRPQVFIQGAASTTARGAMEYLFESTCELMGVVIGRSEGLLIRGQAGVNSLPVTEGLYLNGEVALEGGHL